MDRSEEEKGCSCVALLSEYVQLEQENAINIIGRKCHIG